MEPDPTDFSVELRPGLEATLIVRGDLDLATVDRFDAAIHELLQTPPQRVLLDLGAVTFLDSAGIKGLVKLSSHCRAIGATLSTVDAPDQVRRVLELTQLSELFDLR